MRILFVAAEIAPFVSVGGLSQVMYFLPRALNKIGHDVRVFTPKYGRMDAKLPAGKEWKLHMETEQMHVPVNHRFSEANEKEAKEFLICNVKSYTGRKPNPIAYFLENREYYELRANVFGYSDDHTRFALLSKGCLEWLLQRKHYNDSLKDGEEKKWMPDIIHCNDWHTGYTLQLARQDTRYTDMAASIPLAYTVHNFSYQGNFDFKYANDKDKDDGNSKLAPLLSPKLQKQNALLRGLHHADVVNTVSPTHVSEILTHDYAEGLDDHLQSIRGKLIGILNGLDTKEFNPATDPIIKQNYTEKSFFKARRENKLDLQKIFLLPADPSKIVLGVSGRLSQQKGWDLLFEVLPHLLGQRKDVQLIVLGGGDDSYRRKVQVIKDQFPNQVGLHLQTDFRLPRKIFAGADIFLVPSFFEPGGIVALEALRYGAIPLVRRTGGLNDIIEDFNPQTGKGNGFSFTEKDAWSLYGKIIEALTMYRFPHIWKKLVYNALTCDFSWEHVAKEYEKMYKQLLEERKRALSLTPHPAYNTTIVP